jgi:YD repeat-containing protein
VAEGEARGNVSALRPVLERHCACLSLAKPRVVTSARSTAFWPITSPPAWNYLGPRILRHGSFFSTGSFVYDTCPPGATGCTNAPVYMVQETFAGGMGPNQLTFQYNYTYTPAGKVTSKTLSLQSANHTQNQQGGTVYASASLPVNYGYDNQGAPLFAGVPDPVKSRFVGGDPVWREIPIRDDLQGQYEKCWQTAINAILESN